MTQSERLVCTYSAYGCVIGSEFELPMMPRAKGPLDLLIRAGSPGVDDKHVGGTADARPVDGNEVALRAGEVGTFIVRDGREIIVIPRPEVNRNSLQHLLSGTVLALALQQRGLLVLHGDGVVIEGKAVVFLGDVGAGKSTTTAAFYVRGGSVLCDDVIAISMESTGPVAKSGFPRLKLDPDVANRLDIGINDAPTAYPKSSKRSISSIDRFHQGSWPLAAAYILADGPTVRSETLGLQQAVVELIRHSYCAQFLGESYGARILRPCAAVARAVPVRRLWRPRSFSCLDDLNRAVRADLA